jgi:hypothetical protein
MSPLIYIAGGQALHLNYSDISRAISAAKHKTFQLIFSGINA